MPLNPPVRTHHFTPVTDPRLFRCPDGCDTPVVISPRLLDTLETMRTRVGGPIRVTSGVRCESHNRQVGGVPTSEHLTGEGADLAADTGAQRRFALVEAALAAGVTRIGIGATFVHVGVSTTLPPRVLWLYGPARFAA